MARKAKLGLPLQTLRNAPDALEGRRLRGGIFEIDPELIDTAGRLEDRLQTEIEDLKSSIQKNGQRVPVLVRPSDGDRYSLIYGRRRLEACRALEVKVRAIVTEADEERALRDQLLENQERRDLSFIERALVALALSDGDHLIGSERTNRGIAEVLSLHEAGVSQMLSVVRTVGEDLIQAIGSAPGIGRPRWEDLKKSLTSFETDFDQLVSIANKIRSEPFRSADELSDRAFLEVLNAVKSANPSRTAIGKDEAAFEVPGVGVGSVVARRNGKQIILDLTAEAPEFLSWFKDAAPHLIAELYDRWQRSKD
jgi:ParB family chromosome partitioning protein